MFAVINTGGNTDAPFKVSFFAGDSEKPFDEVTLTGIDSKEVIEVSTVWSAENVDRLRVVVDRDHVVPVGVANQVAVPHLPSQETQVAVAQNDVGVHPKSISQRESEGFVAFNKRFEDW